MADNQDNINNYLVREQKVGGGKENSDPKKRFIFNAEFHVCLHHNKHIKVKKDTTTADVMDAEGSKYSFHSANEAALFYQDTMLEQRRRKEEKLQEFKEQVRRRIKEKCAANNQTKEIERDQVQKKKERKKELYKKMCDYGKQVNKVNMKTSTHNSPRSQEDVPPMQPEPNVEDYEAHEELNHEQEQTVFQNSPMVSKHDSDTSSSMLSKSDDIEYVENHITKETAIAFNTFARKNLASVRSGISQEIYSKYGRGIMRDQNHIVVQAPSFTVYLDEPTYAQNTPLSKPNYIPLDKSHSEDDVSSVPESAQSIIISNPRTVTTKEQKKKEYREEKRYLKQLNKQFLESIKTMNIQMPRLCNCDVDPMDVNAQHSNNCYYFQNKNDFARDLSSLFQSYKI